MPGERQLENHRAQLDRALVKEASDILMEALQTAYSDEPERVEEVLENHRKRLTEEVDGLQEVLTRMANTRENFSDEAASVRRSYELAFQLYSRQRSEVRRTVRPGSHTAHARNS